MQMFLQYIYIKSLFVRSESATGLLMERVHFITFSIVHVKMFCVGLKLKVFKG